MKFTKVGGSKKYFKYSECEAGQVLVESGKFLGRSPNKFGKENFDFKPTDGGPIICLNNAGQLNYLIDTHVRVGDTVQVIYEGSDILDKGAFKGKTVHKFEILVADYEGPTQTELPLDVETIKEVQDVKAERKSPVDLSDLD